MGGKESKSFHNKSVVYLSPQTKFFLDQLMGQEKNLRYQCDLSPQELAKVLFLMLKGTCRTQEEDEPLPPLEAVVLQSD